MRRIVLLILRICTGLKLVLCLDIILNTGTMDQHRQEQCSEERDELASRRRLNIDQPAVSGEYENTSGLREKSVEEDIAPVEPDLEVGEKIEQLKEDSDLDRVK
jgi:hypothetical protein